jgi:hypothetical protein
VIIATAATLSLLLIGLLAVTMTPDKSHPQTVASTTSGTGGTAEALAEPRLPMVTPVGDDGLAVTTTGAVKASSGHMSARLPSGTVVDVEILRRDEDAGLTVVSLPTQTTGYHLARATPAPTDTVAVGGRHSQVVEMLQVQWLDVEEATPVVDGDGDLVGLCSTDDTGNVEVRPVSTLPGTASTTTVAMTTMVPVTAAPVTSTAPTTVAPTRPAPTTVVATTMPPTTAGRPTTTVATAVTTTAPAPTTTVVATTAPS